MIIGAHVTLFSADPAADRAFLRDVLGLPHIDAGRGWLIFALPPAEVLVHPARASGVHELYLICDDIVAQVATLRRQGVRCGAVRDRGWGLLSWVRLPGGGRLGVYQARHPLPAGGTRRPRALTRSRDRR